MTVKLLRWHRSKRNIVMSISLLVIFLLYYFAIHRDTTYEADLSNSAHLYKASSYMFASNLENVVNAQNTKLDNVVSAQNTKLEDKQPSQRETLINYASRDSIIEYVKRTLEDALKEDKGTGCEVPNLDPFAKEVIVFDKVLPKVECPGQDWVKCYLSECKVQEDILASVNDIECTYRDILYVTDYKYTIGPPTTLPGDQVYTLKRSDHVKVACTGSQVDRNNSNQETTTQFLSTKWSGVTLGFRESVHPKTPPYGRGESVNVLILGFDSTARNGFIRRMPKSYKLLTEEFGAIILEGYNIVGDGTPAALLPILAGKNELELPESRKSMKGSGHLDAFPFIFYKLKEDGYRTAYFEDMPWIGTFQYRFNGFLEQPADHYLRQFFLEEFQSGSRWWKKRNKYCVGDTPSYKMMLNVTDQFFRLDGKRFCFTFIADITHDDFNMISTSDDDVVAFLRQFRRQGRLRDTLLMVMGDHGPRYANVRETLQGKLEERLPLMAIVLPEILKEQRPTAEATLRDNVRMLTTPHDIHATLLDAIGLKQYWNMYKVNGSDLYRAMTLLEPIPKNRSCSEAGIEPHWCACLKWDSLTGADPLYQRIAQAFVDHINSITESARSECARRTLTSVQWVQRRRANARVLAFAGARDADGYVGDFRARPALDRDTYQVKITVGPGRGVYEGAVTYFTKEDKFVVSNRDISRISAYNSEPSCISATLPHLNMYCYCRDYTPEENV